MIIITGHLDVRKYDDHRWYLLRNRKCVTDDGRTIQTFRGFIYDGGSTPRSTWTILGLPPMGTAADEGWHWHDALYAWHRDNTPYVSVSHPFTRKESDKLMLDILIQCGISQEQSEAAYIGVRRGASRSWMTPQEKLDSGIIQELPEYYDQ